ncbi:MAG: phosphotransferase family protein [Alphaproteobacteria bacterium]
MQDDLSSLKSALAQAGLPTDSLSAIPTKGVSHDHFRIDGSDLLVRAPRLSQLGLDPLTQLSMQQAAFERAEPSGATPRLNVVLPVSATLPLGALVVERIIGKTPQGPVDLPALARALAAIHALPLPETARRPPIPCPENPLRDLAARAQATLDIYLPKAGMGRAAQDAITDRLTWLGDQVSDHLDLGATALCVSDTHPGNFLMCKDGSARFVDLEKPTYGCPALDLAHTVIDAAAGWDPDAAMSLSKADRDTFANAWLAAAPAYLAEANAPLIRPFRQAVWLRTIGFFMRWRVESAVQGPWSAKNLGPAAANHFAKHVTASLADDAVLAAAEAWFE